jgi:hypothetical protein
MSCGVEPTEKPGFSIPRLGTLITRAVAATGLDLRGLTILTEAATGAYATTAVIAAMAGAERVYALARSSRYGSAREIEASIHRLSTFMGVADRITIVELIPDDLVRQIDIVTNSGHLRPLKAELINLLPDHAIVALMFEAWEFRPEDLDLDTCARRGIRVVGVNERHPAIDVFSFLGPLCVNQLHECGLAVHGSRLALLCDNPFAQSMLRGLEAGGASIEIFSKPGDLFRDDWDAIVVAMRPTSSPCICKADAAYLSSVAPAGTPLVQFWGDVDRAAALACGLNVWPPREPGKGHMGVMLSDIGPEPIVRLQTGGLKAAEWVHRGGGETPDGFAQFVRRP